MNSGVVNVHVHDFVCTFVFISLGFIPRGRIAGSYRLRENPLQTGSNVKLRTSILLLSLV